MPSIAVIGAGSIVFTRNLMNDVLLTPALQESDIRLMDIDERRLRQARDLVQTMIDRRGLKATLLATTDQRDALRNVDYVITTFQQGGLEAYALDIEIPQKYGIEQCVGDTLGPGGVFRGLRTIPVLLELCNDLDDVAPDALILNYANPMAINCWAIEQGTGRPCVGLCTVFRARAQCWQTGSACRMKRWSSAVRGSTIRRSFSNFATVTKTSTHAFLPPLNAPTCMAQNRYASI